MSSVSNGDSMSDSKPDRSPIPAIEEKSSISLLDTNESPVELEDRQQQSSTAATLAGSRTSSLSSTSRERTDLAVQALTAELNDIALTEADDPNRNRNRSSSLHDASSVEGSVDYSTDTPDSSNTIADDSGVQRDESGAPTHISFSSNVNFDAGNPDFRPPRSVRKAASLLKESRRRMRLDGVIFEGKRKIEANADGKPKPERKASPSPRSKGLTAYFRKNDSSKVGKKRECCRETTPRGQVIHYKPYNNCKMRSGFKV